MPSKKKQYKFTYKGKRWAVRADSDREAGALIAQKKAEIDSSTPSSSMSLRAWYDMNIDTYTLNQSDTSQEVTRYMIEHYLLEELGAKPIQAIKPAELQQILNNHKDKSQTTIKYIYSGMKFLFKYAYNNQLIDSDPTNFLIKPKGTKKKREALTPEEKQAVIDVAKTNRSYYGYLLMLYCGCRPGEAWECKGEDLQQVNGVNVLHIRGTKTASADRFVPVPEDLYTLIKNTPKNEYIACTDDGRKIDGNYGRRWKHFLYHVNIKMGAKTFRNALVDRPFRDELVPYCLRHSYCTDLAIKGVDIRVAQKLMGHSSIRMTADVYTNLDTEDVLAAASKFIS